MDKDCVFNIFCYFSKWTASVEQQVLGSECAELQGICTLYKISAEHSAKYVLCLGPDPKVQSTEFAKLNTRFLKSQQYMIEFQERPFTVKNYISLVCDMKYFH